MRAGGFSLVETLIYLALFCMVGVVASRFMAGCHLAVSATQKKAIACMAAHTALPRLRQDVQMADPSAGFWQQKDSADLSFIDSTGKPIRWTLLKGNLYRIQERSKALIAQGVQRFSIKITVRDQQIRQLECTIRSGEDELTQTMRPYNGTL